MGYDVYTTMTGRYMFTDTAAYRKAFIQYLRYGTPIEFSMKGEEHSTRYYIWRTRGDNKVRPFHAANNGRIFAWDDPPATGHPGEDYNCRCTAEPYNGSADMMINDPPIQPIYPELLLLPVLRLGRGAITLAVALLRRIHPQAKIIKSDLLTEHGAIRSVQRRISVAEAEEAIKTAKETGNVVTKTGKYGTLQLHYKGSNGVTVIVETTGRNAGKIITSWKH